MGDMQVPALREEIERLRAVERRARELTEAGTEEGAGRFYRHAARYILHGTGRPSGCAHVRWLDITRLDSKHLQEMCAACGARRERDRQTLEIVPGGSDA